MAIDTGFLFPHPRHVELGAATCPPGAAVRTALDPSLPAEGYRLTVADDEIRIDHADDAGRAHADATLGQLRRQFPDRLPTGTVEDHPDLSVRGYHLDVSRDRVPTRATLARLVEVMSRARMNHLQLYVEHTFAYADHEEVWHDASPLTADDLRWLDARCAERGIELAANQNCFGHMERWLAHDAYRSRAELPEGLELTPGLTLPPSTLAPTEDNARFVLDLVAEQQAALSGRTVNIGCDETFELGRGVSADAVRERGAADVWAEHVARVANPLADDGRRVLFWDDVVRRRPEALHHLPDEAVALVWWYEAPQRDLPVAALAPEIRDLMARIGLDLDEWSGYAPGFSAVTEPLAGTGRPFWVCPGTSSWNSFVGRIDNARANLLDAARVGVERGAGGYLVTDWGDNGHHQPPSVSFPAILYAGAVSWCAATNADADVTAVLDRDVFADRAEVLGGLLDAIGRVWHRTGEQTFNASPLAAEVVSGMFLPGAGAVHPARANAVAGALDDALTALGRARPACADADDVVVELDAAIRLARHGARRLAARGGGAAGAAERLRLDFDEVRDAQGAAWDRRARPGGRADSLAKLRPPPD
ncbi:family 20 glycosylhydrolase [Rhabdothermincola salaria]|uniref:family 20 glycosylhydrolase n=1 Tax=Rhabdothermincola salaria TaxID=2903142 RepID=UPI001E56945F|nr:family 20 glycosylhydrolase [Rhabdothermincola salaria]MCD9623650.1 beta-N-acetylhexosaminidase [Rhabdothermincola salaria]